ncbi:hypothetical protein D3C83_108290 [compost metagenome]
MIAFTNIFQKSLLDELIQKFVSYIGRFHRCKNRLTFESLNKWRRLFFRESDFMNELLTAIVLNFHKNTVRFRSAFV